MDVNHNKIASQLDYLSKTRSYTSFHSKEERERICQGCDGNFCRERVHDAHKCIYQALSTGSTAIFDLTALLEVEQTKNAKLLVRAEAAEVRCETLEKMVKQYQEELIPGYRERAEKAERERDAAKGALEEQKQKEINNGRF